MIDEQINPNFYNDSACCHESLKSIVKSALVKKFQKGDERPCSESDFPEKKNREKITSEIHIILQNFLNNSSQNSCSDIESEFLALILILCGQNEALHPWNTEITVKNCKIIQMQIVNFFNCKNMSEFVSEFCKNNLMRTVFQILCSDLTASDWKHFPASVISFSWILKMIKQPHLSQYLQFVLPPALLLTDDYINENKIIGVKCLKHIIQNITIAELQLCGHGNVIYSALIPLLRIREAELLNITLPPLISLTAKLEFDIKKKDLTKWSKFDDILEIFLENMELEQVIDLRNCYISNLELLIDDQRFGITRWSKRLLRIFHEYIQTAKKFKDEKASNLCLKTIEKYMDASNDLVYLYAKNLLVTTMLALHQSSSSKSEIQEQNKQISINCIKKLLESMPKTVRQEFENFLQGKHFCNVNFEI